MDKTDAAVNTGVMHPLDFEIEHDFEDLRPSAEIVTPDPKDEDINRD